MALIFNGTTVKKVIKDGANVGILKYGNTEVFRNRLLRINYIGHQMATTSDYPLIIRSPSIEPVAIYGASVTKDIYIPDGETVYIDFRQSIIKAWNSFHVSGDYGSEYVEYWTSHGSSRPYSFTYWDIYPITDGGNNNALAFTMDKDYTFNPVSRRWPGSTDIVPGTLYIGKSNDGKRVYCEFDCLTGTTRPTNMRPVQLT